MLMTRDIYGISPAKSLVVAVGSQNPVKVNSVRAAFVANFPESTIEVIPTTSLTFGNSKPTVRQTHCMRTPGDRVQCAEWRG